MRWRPFGRCFVDCPTKLLAILNLGKMLNTIKIIIVFTLVSAAIYLAPTHATRGLADPLAYKEQLCIPGYSSSVRPPSGYTTSLKIAQLEKMGLSTKDLGAWEEDHFVPISLGGSPADPKNLSPQPFPEAHYKDTVEWDLYHRMCKGEITLGEAQKMIQDWEGYYQKMKKGLGASNIISEDLDQDE